MAQAKGVLPREDDRDVLYKNPRTCGYFLGIALDPAIDRARVELWLERVSGLVDRLVTRLPPRGGELKGEKVAAVAVGFAPRFFVMNSVPRFELEPPVWFAPDVPLPDAVPPLQNVEPIDADVLFYIASTREARINAFVSDLAAMNPDVQRVTLERGYQREDETEPFGYRDGLRNVRPSTRRPRHVFVHRDGNELDEPLWADGGTYMTYLKILQRPEQFAALPDDGARDATIGRLKDGTRLDLVGRGIDARDEPADVPDGLPPTSHVRKAGPRGPHDDNQIFRRGLPFVETTEDGKVRIGLNFSSFQATLAQFDVVFNDWLMSRQFPPQQSGADPGVDALLDPARQLTEIEKIGIYFVPPYDERGSAAAIFAPRRQRPAETGRLVIHKRVVDQNDQTRRFQRRGFSFQILDAQNQPVANSQFVTDSTGRGLCPVELTVGQNYTLQELSSPVSTVQPQSTPFTMDKRNKQLHIVNQVTQPNIPYGG
jgi:deferrochelatase/peroxidase EfeB